MEEVREDESELNVLLAAVNEIKENPSANRLLVTTIIDSIEHFSDGLDSLSSRSQWEGPSGDIILLVEAVLELTHVMDSRSRGRLQLLMGINYARTLDHCLAIRCLESARELLSPEIMEGEEEETKERKERAQDEMKGRKDAWRQYCAQCLSALGSEYQATQEEEKAEEAIDKALQLYTTLNEEAPEVESLYGYILCCRGKLSEGVAHLERSTKPILDRVMERDQPINRMEGIMLSRWASGCLLSAQFGLAREIYDRLLSTQDSEILFTASLGLAQFYESIEYSPAAASYAFQALSLATDSPPLANAKPRAAGLLAYQLASLMLQGGAEEAHRGNEMLRSLLDMAEESYAEDIRKKRTLSAATPTAIAEMVAEGDISDGVNLFFLGQAHLEMGDYESARQIYEDKLCADSSIVPKWRTPQLFMTIGICYQRLGKREKAIEWGKKSVVAYEEIANELHRHDSSGLLLSKSTAEFCYEFLQQVLIEAGDTEASLETCERRKARPSLQLLLEYKRKTNQQEEPLLPEEHFNCSMMRKTAIKYSAAIATYSVRWLGHVVGDTGDAEDDARLFVWVIPPSDFKPIVFRNESIKERLGGRELSDFFATRKTDESVHSDRQSAKDEAQQDEDEEEEWMRWNVSKLKGYLKEKGVSAQDCIERSDLVAKVQCLKEEERQQKDANRTRNFEQDDTGRSEEWKERLYLLHNLLIEPIASELPQRVIFVPDDYLFLVPFAALLNSATNRYLVQDHVFSLVPSIRFLALLPPSPTEITPSSTMVMADPENHGWPRLGGARSEGEVVAKELATELTFYGPKATPETAMRLLPTMSLFHFSGHGGSAWLPDRSEDEDPWAHTVSGALVLSCSRQDPKEKGFLWATEIARLQLRPGLVVVLSGCNTGCGLLTGDGVGGLARAFLTSGASTVVASVSPVFDEQTQRLMAEFYRNLKANPIGGAAHALHTSMNAMLPHCNHPSEWAPFVVLGGL